jgi:hypothetical protein
LAKIKRVGFHQMPLLRTINIPCHPEEYTRGSISLPAAIVP